MTTISKHYVEVLVEAAELAGVDLRLNYNGRSMGDRTCIGIVAHDLSLAHEELIAALEEVGDDSDLTDTLLNNNTARDNMGKRSIMYWPTLQAES